jgi:oligosaccharide repeat unit polymerase
MNDILSSPWIPTGFFGYLVLAAHIQQESWIAPSVFAPLAWLFYILVPLVVAPEYRISALAVWLVLLLIASVTLGAMIAEGRRSGVFAVSADHLSRLSVPRLLRWTLLLNALSFAGALYAAAKAVNDYGLGFSFPELMSVGHLLSVERYGGEQTPALVRLLVTWTFPAALLAGISYVLARSRRERILCFSVLLPALTFSVVQAAKANTLIAAALATGGYLATRVMLGTDRFRPVSKRTLLLLATAIVASLLLFLTVDLFRTYRENDQPAAAMEVDWGRIKSATVGYLAVFSHWVDKPEGLNSAHLDMGVYTFGGLFDAVGLHPRQIGVYDEMVTLDADDHYSNIYTAFRGLIQDFSLPGAVAICFLIGYISGFAFNMGRRGHAWALVTLAAFYSFMIWSPIVSVFVYNGPILAIGVAAVLLRKASRKTCRPRVEPGILQFEYFMIRRQN